MRRVLVARLDSAGDVLLAGPAVRAVAAADVRVSLLCGPRGEAAAKLLPGVDELLCWRADWIDPEPEPISRARIEELVGEVAARRFDEALIITSFHQSPLPLALLLRLAGVPRIAAISDDYPGSLLDVRHRVDAEAHEVQRGLSLAAACGYELPDGDEGSLQIKRCASLHPDVAELGTFVAVHPGASVSARAWSARRSAQLVRLLCERRQRVVVTGSPGERELTAQVCRAGSPGRALDLGGHTTLAELVEVIAAARALVVGNTGPAHIAAAVGTPVVSIYAPTVPAMRWRPWQVEHELLHRDVPCAGCRARECPVPGHPCIEAVSAAEALAALARLTDGLRPAAYGVSGMPAAEPPGMPELAEVAR